MIRNHLLHPSLSNPPRQAHLYMLGSSQSYLKK